MSMHTLTRRAAMLGTICALGGCSALGALNAASTPLDTYDLLPAPGSQSGARKSQTLLVARPQASAALTSDRIMIKPDPASITYLPDARWSDEVPAVVQSLLIRSISGTGRVAYVGGVDGGPVPDKVVLSRIDAFEVHMLADGTFEARLDVDLSIINDRNQRVIATRAFSQSTAVSSDDVTQIVSAFQSVLNVLLPVMADWALQRI